MCVCVCVCERDRENGKGKEEGEGEGGRGGNECGRVRLTRKSQKDSYCFLPTSWDLVLVMMAESIIFCQRDNRNVLTKAASSRS